MVQERTGDHITRNHKEDVNPNKATRQPGLIEMENQHRQHGDATQGIDIRSVAKAGDLGSFGGRDNGGDAAGGCDQRETLRIWMAELTGFRQAWRRSPGQ